MVSSTCYLPVDAAYWNALFVQCGQTPGMSAASTLDVLDLFVFTKCLFITKLMRL